MTLVLDARVIGLGAAVIALLLRAPVLVVVVVAAAAAALARLVGIGLAGRRQAVAATFGSARGTRNAAASADAVARPCPRTMIAELDRARGQHPGQRRPDRDAEVVEGHRDREGPPHPRRIGPPLAHREEGDVHRPEEQPDEKHLAPPERDADRDRCLTPDATSRIPTTGMSATIGHTSSDHSRPRVSTRPKAKADATPLTARRGEDEADDRRAESELARG